MVLRVATVTTLLVSALAIELVLNPGQTLRPLFLLAAAAYGASLLYAALDRWIHGRLAFAYLQALGDSVLIAALVGITGGATSAMTFLFLTPICVAAVLDLRRGALVVAAFCGALYTATVLSGNSFAPLGRLVPAIQEIDPGRMSLLPPRAPRRLHRDGPARLVPGRPGPVARDGSSTSAAARSSGSRR